MLTKESLKSIPQSIWDKLEKKLAFEEALEKKHLQMIGELISKYTFKVLLEKLISKHDKSYEDRCYKKGCMPYPNNLLDTLFFYMKYNGVLTDEVIKDTDFLTKTFLYEGFYLVYMYGHGTIAFIYNENKELIFQI